MTKLYIILFIFLLVSCANIQNPTGGAKDERPPVVVASYPTNYTTNFDGVITFKFDKWMDRNSVLQNLTIIPEVSYETDWSGKELEITLTDNLKPNTTYSVILGTEYTDYLKNKPEKSQSIVFSTGSNIDTGSIAGIVIADKYDGLSMFAWSDLNHNFDTLNLNKTKPDYKIQIGSDSTFLIPGLKDAKYRLVVVKDILKNSIIDDNDPYGVARFDYEVRNSISQLAEIKLGILIDNQKPEILNINTVYQDRIRIRFSEKMNDSSVFSSKFVITDTSNNILANSKYVISNPELNTTFDFVLSQKITEQNVLSIKFDDNSIPLDSAGNQLNLSKSVRFLNFNRVDTNKVILDYKPFTDSASNIGQKVPLRFTFNSALDKTKMNLKYKLTQVNNNKEYELDTISSPDNIITFIPIYSLDDKKDYILNIEFNNLINASNNLRTDTIIKLFFTTEDLRATGEILGKFIPTNFKCNSDNYIILKSKHKTIMQKLSETGGFIIDKLPEDSYEVEIFCDINQNGHYDYGTIVPFSFAEPYYIHDRTILVKPRFTIENLNILENSK